MHGNAHRSLKRQLIYNEYKCQLTIDSQITFPRIGEKKKSRPFGAAFTMSGNVYRVAEVLIRSLLPTGGPARDL